MSPLRILATVANQCPFTTFLLFRWGAPRLRASVFVRLFLSLRPDCVPTPPRMDKPGRLSGRLEEDLRNRSERIALPMRRGLAPLVRHGRGRPLRSPFRSPRAAGSPGRPRQQVLQQQGRAADRAARVGHGLTCELPTDSPVGHSRIGTGRALRQGHERGHQHPGDGGRGPGGPDPSAVDRRGTGRRPLRARPRSIAGGQGEGPGSRARPSSCRDTGRPSCRRSRLPSSQAPSGGGVR